MKTLFQMTTSIENDGKWLINLYGIAMIPENKDLRKLDVALE